MTASLSGVLGVDKPAGPTSHDVVARVRKALGVRRAGHTGTLDPFATGVLPVCVGKATRLARFLSAGEKSYRATVRLGFATSTDDSEGEPLGPPRQPVLQAGSVEQACGRLTGELLQVPPMFSARHVGGKRLYEWAREGVAVARPPARVTVYALEIREMRSGEIDLEVRCSAGTYIRALARDLGEALGCGAHLSALRRTGSGGLGLQDCVSWEEIGEACLPRLRALETLLPEIPAVQVDAAGREAVRHGRAVTPRNLLRGDPGPGLERVRLVDAEGRLLALALSRDGELRPDVVLMD